MNNQALPDLLHKFFTQVPAHIHVTQGPEHEFIFFHPLTASLVGGRDLTGRKIREALPELESQGYFDLLDEVYQKGISHIEKEKPALLLDKHGNLVERYFDVTFNPYLDEKGITIGVFIFATEVTSAVLERKEMEYMHRELKFAAALSENIIDAVIGTDTIENDFRIISWNQGAARMYGYTREEVIGRPSREVLRTEFLSEDTKINWHENWTKMDWWQGEVIQHKSDNSMMYVLASVAHVKDKNGKSIGAVAINRDITHRKTMEQALQQAVEERTAELKKSQQHFNQLFQVSPVAKSLTRLSDGMLVDANPAWARMFRKSLSDIQGKTSIEIGLVSAEQRNSILEKISANGGTINGLEVQYNLGDQILDVYLSAVTIDMEGENYLLAAYFDLSERKAAEEEIKKSAHNLAEKHAALERVNKDLESFNYVASHDLQEPLRKIQTFINLIQTKKLDAETKDRYLEKIDVAANRMSNLIKSMLDYGKLSSPIESVTTDLNQTLEDVKNDFELLITEKKAVILCNHLPTVQAGPLQMHQLFSNLISNSMKFSINKPVIKINWAWAEPLPQFEADPNRRYIQLTFQDNGIGFDPQFKEKIFTLFQRLHGKHEYQGAGIGLSIVKKIVEQHHGFITADSNPDEGAVFRVWLPA